VGTLTLIPVLQFLAVLSAALFSGAALYINIAEHPARMSLDTRMAALQWAPSYKRATRLQAPLAIVSLFCGVLVWLQGGRVGWLIASLLVGSVVPFTLGIIMPTNHKLLAPDLDLSSLETRQLLIRWGRLHAVRTALGLMGTVIYLLLLLGA
jgi:Anthrone oxygenase